MALRSYAGEGRAVETVLPAEALGERALRESVVTAKRVWEEVGRVRGWAENVIEKGVGIFIPPACREEVLGDLRERNEGSQLFLYDALRTVPFVILSRVRRTTDSVVVLMEAFCCYICYLAAAWVFQPSMVQQQSGLLRLAIPGGIAIVVLMLADAYADPRKKSVLRPVLAVALAIACVFAVQAARTILPNMILAIGSGGSLLFLLVLRMLFPPIADRPQMAQGSGVLAEAGDCGWRRFEGHRNRSRGVNDRVFHASPFA